MLKIFIFLSVILLYLNTSVCQHPIFKSQFTVLLTTIRHSRIMSDVIRIPFKIRNTSFELHSPYCTDLTLLIFISKLSSLPNLTNDLFLKTQFYVVGESLFSSFTVFLSTVTSNLTGLLNFRLVYSVFVQKGARAIKLSLLLSGLWYNA